MSFATSLSGMRNAETDLRVIANNIANAETVAFKKSNASFADLIARGSSNDPRRTPGIGATVQVITQDFSLGAIEQTGRGLDIAINGDGFFVSVNPNNAAETYSRNGNFRIDASGALLDSNGNFVQAFAVDATGAPTTTTPGTIAIPTTNGAGSPLSSVSIEGDGVLTAVYGDGTAEPVLMVALASFAATTGLRPLGLTQYEATGESGAADYGAPASGNFGDLFSGALERSNVDLAGELVALLGAQRNFQANARALDTATAISQTVLNLQR
ncbi:flagellar hook basal-body protein [Erythrobacter sp. YT30]|uniref:flagellar hook basal-body protein n=1 Tax=Erythrobacter sp. YT30 TaxID=1735012 RepID=UPI00076BC88D|nr:flagellar hook basal-body protein [Erythrobacter sp. YT30]KWV91668.1 flagellar biosynthesis protein FlgE [Erythrobacter sp. YT30]